MGIDKWIEEAKAKARVEKQENKLRTKHREYKIATQVGAERAKTFLKPVTDLLEPTPSEPVIAPEPAPENVPLPDDDYLQEIAAGDEAEEGDAPLEAAALPPVDPPPPYEEKNIKNIFKEYAARSGVSPGDFSNIKEVGKAKAVLKGALTKNKNAPDDAVIIKSGRFKDFNKEMVQNELKGVTDLYDFIKSHEKMAATAAAKAVSGRGKKNPASLPASPPASPPASLPASPPAASSLTKELTLLIEAIAAGNSSFKLRFRVAEILNQLLLMGEIREEDASELLGAI